MAKRKQGKDRPVELEADELEQPVFDEKAVSRADMEQESKKSQSIGGATDPNAGEDEDTIALGGDHSYSLDAATDTEFPTLSEVSEVVMDEIDRYTDDDDVLQDFAERQLLNTGRDELIERLEVHHSKTPDLSGGDIDARWEDADVSGEESVGGTVTTPDQDVVDELGTAVGINYEANQPLATADMLNERDENRFELSSASMESDPDENDANLLVDLADDLDTDLMEALTEEDEERLEDNLDAEFAVEIDEELNPEQDLELDDDDEDDLEDENDEAYDLEDLDDELDDPDDFLDDEYLKDDED